MTAKNTTIERLAEVNASDAKTDRLARTLDDAVAAVAHTASEVAGDARPMKDGFFILAEDMAELREAIKAWNAAGEALIRHARANPS